MAIIRTDLWLTEHFYEPEQICKKLKEVFHPLTTIEIFEFLLEKGMYKPSILTYKDFQQLKSLNIWGLVEKYFYYYRKKWNGPDITIYIFPLNHSLFSSLTKNGFTFKDKMLLFLSPNINFQEINALFVHEYHHACRIHRLDRSLENFSLLDSIIMEGLAEFAVYDYCGDKFVADWCKRYSEKELVNFWKIFFHDHHQIAMNHPLHDQLLYGKKNLPPFIGYALGFGIVKNYRDKYNSKTNEMFSLDAREIAKPFLQKVGKDFKINE